MAESGTGVPNSKCAKALNFQGELAAAGVETVKIVETGSTARGVDLGWQNPHGRNQAPPFESDAREKLRKRWLVEVAAPLRDPANEEFLRQAGADPFRRAQRKIAEYQAGTAIGFWVIEVAERGGCQVSS